MCLKLFALGTFFYIILKRENDNSRKIINNPAEFNSNSASFQDNPASFHHISASRHPKTTNGITRNKKTSAKLSRRGFNHYF